MFLTEYLRQEIEYFKKLHESFSIQLGKENCLVKDASENVLYMLLTASLVMDIAEDELFENFIITDKALTHNNEMLIDAFAFIDTENSKEKQLHVFQYKLHEQGKHSASPKELYSFITLINNEFLHPEVADLTTNNEALKKIKGLVDKFLEKRGNKVTVKCHYINNAEGINPNDEKSFSFLTNYEYDKQTYGFDVQVYGIKDIEDLLKYGKIKVGKETIRAECEYRESYRYEDNTEKEELGLPGKIFIGMVNINELIRLQNKYHRNQLYSENVRLYLGNRGSVNKAIIETITNNESQWFPYMNNGISIICDEFKLGTPNLKTKEIELDLSNMQIINGCQTVNALYNAKYDESTRNNFKSSKVLVKIYQIKPTQTKFKLAIIKATNNQNAVKPYSLVSNDPIQIKIQEILKKLDFFYDRKGEVLQLKKGDKVISMVDSAIAYKAFYNFEAKDLRSGVGKGRIFKEDEYKKLYKPEYLEDENKLKHFAVRLLISSIVINKCREEINSNSSKYISELKIFNKSLYYLTGLLYALNYKCFSNLEDDLINLLEENNLKKITNYKIYEKISSFVNEVFDISVKKLEEFYNSLTDIDKSDIDNLLKNIKFYKKYLEISEIKKIMNNNDYEE